MRNTTVVCDDFRHGYLEGLRMILDDGAEVAPRGLNTLEVLNYNLVLQDPTRCLASGVGRKLHLGVAAGEALQLVGGFTDARAMCQISPHFARFMDGGEFHAPYGPRVLPQLQRVVERIVLDRDTRQAVIQVWDPARDLYVDGFRDYPCTTQLQLMVRGGRLDLHVSMRANDAWHGHPYDVFQFCQLQCSLANVLDVEPGTYYHHATSFHLYEPQWDAVDAMSFDVDHVPVRYDGVWARHDVGAMTEWARRLFYGTVDPLEEPYLHEGEKRLFDALRRAGVEGRY